MGESFPRTARLTRSRELNTVRAEGVRVHAGPFLIQLRRDERSTSGPRLGVIATRRIGNAVARHRSKRRMREVFRKNREILPPGTEVVLIARDGIEDLAWSELVSRYRDGINRALARITSHRRKA